ncbi:MAG: hypothetical protein H6732_18660 [Alphaproteobacteria bacterium]|nr:hypothetical protein [Alphaproteobacteria bacterium]
MLDRFAFDAEADRVGRQAVELAEALPCPAGRMHVLGWRAHQMMLQIHESIGHPEPERHPRRRAQLRGTSFVTPGDVRQLPLRQRGCLTSPSIRGFEQ